MKLTAVSNKQIRQNKTNNQNSNIQFGGLTNTLVKAWEIIDSSRGIQFTVEDMLGTNIPRTYSGAMSGYEYTGKINWPYFWQEGIREFLTGPTMTCAPIALLALITKTSGRTANTHKENIVNLSYLANKIQQKEGLDENAFTNSFIKDIVKDTLTKTINTDPKTTQVLIEENDPAIDELAELIVSYTKQTKMKDKEKGLKGIINSIAGFFNRKTRCINKANKIEANATLANAQMKFQDIVKDKKTSFENTDFKIAKYSINETETGATTFKNYVKFISAFIDDYANTNKDEKGFINLATETNSKFKDTWTSKRIGTIGALIFGTGIIMSFIPKLYTLASGGINPGGKAIYDEAAKREGK